MNRSEGVSVCHLTNCLVRYLWKIYNAWIFICIRICVIYNEYIWNILRSIINKSKIYPWTLNPGSLRPEILCPMLPNSVTFLPGIFDRILMNKQITFYTLFFTGCNWRCRDFSRLFYQFSTSGDYFPSNSYTFLLSLINNIKHI